MIVRESRVNRSSARVCQTDKGTAILYSYSTPVVAIDQDQNVTIADAWNISVTTQKHIRVVFGWYAKDVRGMLASGRATLVDRIMVD